MSKTPESVIHRVFALQYGLFGLMTVLPTSPKFMEYENVYLPKNHLNKEETMRMEDYLALFYQFDKKDVIKRGVESLWDIQNCRAMMALAMTMSDKPMAVSMCFQREYAERYDWLKRQFSNWIFVFSTSMLYYETFDKTDEDTGNLFRQSMAAFDGNAQSYHIALYDKPTIMWDFHSLLLGIQMMFSFMLKDDKNRCSCVSTSQRFL